MVPEIVETVHPPISATDVPCREPLPHAAGSEIMEKSPVTPGSVTIGLVQHAADPDSATNLARALDGIREARRGGASIVCLQELFRTPYFCQTQDPSIFDLAEPVDGPTTRAVGAVARELEVAVIVPIFERRAAGLHHNTAVTVGPDGAIAGAYRKMHIPHDPLFFEKYYFAPGDCPERAPPPVEVCGVRLGNLICWDQWYPEAARLSALAGAQILFYPTAIGWHATTPPEERQRERDAWQTIQRSHAIANGVYVVAVNRVGPEGDLRFWGSSFVAGPFGEILAEAGEESAVLTVTCDLQRIEATRRLWPFLRDRRTDAYGAISERYLDV